MSVQAPIEGGVLRGEAIAPTIGGQEGFETGFTVEHIMLSITVISTKESAGQFDDSCAYIVEKGLNEYHGVVRSQTEVLYKHTKIEQHPNDCTCGFCDPDGERWKAYQKRRDAFMTVPAPDAQKAKQV